MTRDMPPPPGDEMQSEKILLVDDNPMNLQVLYQTLEGRGYNLLVAKDGESALRDLCGCIAASLGATRAGRR